MVNAMVRGIEGFRNWFAEYSNQFTIIGGTACDLLMSENGLEFRATKDLDIVLIVEGLTPDFGHRFWKYIQAGGYEHRNRSTGAPQFYRFTNPKSKEYPYMLELFSRRGHSIRLPEDAMFTPLPLDDELSSLSAILLDEDYYQFLLEGRILVKEIPVLSVKHLIPFKAKAWLDLTKRRNRGEQVDGKNIRKHKNDVFRLSVLLTPETNVVLPEAIRKDMEEFFTAMEFEETDLKSLEIRNQTKEDAIIRLKNIYGLS